MSETSEGLSAGSWSGTMIASREPGASCWGKQCLYLPQSRCAQIVRVSFASKPQAGAAASVGTWVQAGGSGSQRVCAGIQGTCKPVCVCV